MFSMISRFTDAETCLSEVSPAELATVLGAAADIVLVLDREGIVEDVAFELDDAAALAVAAWRGCALAELIEPGSRATLRGMLAAAHGRRHGLRQILRHKSAGTEELPVSYVATAVGGSGRVLLLGRDQRGYQQMQTRLVSERMEFDRRRREQARDEARYRQLFEFAPDAQLLVDAATGLVREANLKAASVLGTTLAALAGSKLSRLFERTERAAIQALCEAAAGTLAVSVLTATVEASQLGLRLSVQPLRGDERGQVLVRLELDPGRAPAAMAVDDRLAAMLRTGREAVVLTDPRGGMVWANESFLKLAGIDEKTFGAGHALAEYLQFEQLEFSVVLTNLRRYAGEQTLRGALRAGDAGARAVEVAVTALLDDTPPAVGFILRAPPADVSSLATHELDLFRSAEELTGLVGKVPLKGMVRDATDRVEKMCIEAALRLTGNNRALAAKVLGMSRQGLYQKLHQFQLADNDDTDTDTSGEV